MPRAGTSERLWTASLRSATLRPKMPPKTSATTKLSVKTMAQPGHPHRTLQPAVLGWAMVFTLSLVVAEVFGGIFGRSVALLNDAVHNLSDVPALGISYLAMR